MEIQEEIVQRLRTIAEDMHSLKKEIEGLNDAFGEHSYRTEKMYKTDKQWLELIVGGAGLAYMGSAIILAAIFSFAYKFF